jgi:hypothetical protein
LRVTSELSGTMAGLSGLRTPPRGEPYIRPVLPLGQVNALRHRILHLTAHLPLRPNLKEVIVATTVMVATAAVSLLGIALVW